MALPLPLFLSLPLAVLSLAPTPAGAQALVNPYDEPLEADIYRVEERLVTVASRYSQTVEQAPGIVTVVTDSDFRDRGFRTVSDVLGSLPGIHLSTAPEGRTLAWFRGVIAPDNNKFLLMVDGVPWYDGIYTHAWIDEYIPLENVRQVEIIKGPGSAIYGTNAFSGVVNVVTYRPEDLKGGFARVVAGSHATGGASVVMADHARLPGNRTVGVSGIVRFLGTDGHGMDVNPKGEWNIHGAHPRRAVNAGMRVTAGGLDLSLNVADYRHTYFTQPQDDTLDVLLQSMDEFNLSYRDEFFSARYRWEPGRLLALTPYLYFQHHDDPGAYAWFSDPAVEEAPDGGYEASWRTTLVQTEKETARIGAGLEVEARPGTSHVLVGGLGWEATRVRRLEDIIYSDLTGEPTLDFRMDPDADPVISNLFAYAQDSWTILYWLEVTGGLRLDMNSVSGFFPSPRLGVLLVPSTVTTVKLLYGRAFRAPSARELLVMVERDDDGSNRWTAGNPNLDPERIETVEAEVLLHPSKSLNLRAAVFASAIRDEIDKRGGDRPHPVLGDAYYDNFAGSDVLGAEAEGTGRAGPMELAASLAWTRAVDRHTERTQYAFPPLSFHGRATLRLSDSIRGSVLLDHVGRRPRAEWSPDAGLGDGPSFTLLHAALATDLLSGGRLRLDASVRNIMDTEYHTLIYRDDANAVRDGSARYPVDIAGAGRTFLVGLEAAL